MSGEAHSKPLHSEAAFPGVVPDKILRRFITDIDGFIHDESGEALQKADASAFDLTLSEECWILPGCCRPTYAQTVMDMITRLGAQRHVADKNNVYKFDKGKVYLCRLRQSVRLHEKFRAKATGKSSIGRLDVLAHLVADYQTEYDIVDCRAAVRERRPPISLYVEISPITFNISVPIGGSLNQLRVYRGDFWSCVARRAEIASLDDSPLCTTHSGMMFSELLKHGPTDDEKAVWLSVKIKNENGFCAYRALPNKTDYLDVGAKNEYTIKDFWEELPAMPNQSMILQPDRFHILVSNERLRVPYHYAVDCRAYTESLGELRIHYAGFAHPGFGEVRKDGKSGTPLIFEVRCHNVQTVLRDGDRLARIYFCRMSELPDKPYRDGYQEQELQLSKVFKNKP